MDLIIRFDPEHKQDRTSTYLHDIMTVYHRQVQIWTELLLPGTQVESTVVASTYWNNWETIMLLSKEKKGHTRYHMLHHLYELIGQLTLHRVHWCPLFHPHWFWKYFCIFFSSIGHFKKSLLKCYKSWTKTTKQFFVVLYITVQQITNNNVKTTTEKFKLSQQTAKQ